MIGPRIQELLDAQGSNAAELARHCGVSQTAAHKWIDGAEPRRKRKEAIAAFFGISLQEFEYGPVLSLVPIVGQKAKKSHATLDIATSEQAAEIMIFSELNTCAPKSAEYRQGMLDAVIFRLSGFTRKTTFQIGTAQLDAYNAGAFHGENLINRIEVPNLK